MRQLHRRLVLQTSVAEECHGLGLASLFCVYSSGTPAGTEAGLVKTGARVHLVRLLTKWMVLFCALTVLSAVTFHSMWHGCTHMILTYCYGFSMQVCTEMVMAHAGALAWLHAYEQPQMQDASSAMTSKYASCLFQPECHPCAVYTNPPVCHHSMALSNTLWGDVERSSAAGSAWSTVVNAQRRNTMQ